MNFDHFNEINFEYKDSLLEQCKVAEKNVYTDPYATMANARGALELLCKGLIKEHNIPRVKNEDGTADLSTMIETCLQGDVFQNGIAATNVRKSGNTVVHV